MPLCLSYPIPRLCSGKSGALATESYSELASLSQPSAFIPMNHMTGPRDVFMKTLPPSIHAPGAPTYDGLLESNKLQPPHPRRSSNNEPSQPAHQSLLVGLLSLAANAVVLGLCLSPATQLISNHTGVSCLTASQEEPLNFIIFLSLLCKVQCRSTTGSLMC